MWPLRSTPLVFTLAQSFCSHSWQRCCDSELYGPEGDVSCWRDGRTFESCCGGGRVKAAQADAEPGPPSVTQETPALTEDFTSASVSCWRSGYSFKFCCARHKPRGDASCWDETFTYERCCQPPVPRAEGTLLEDFDGLRDAPVSLQILLTDLKTLVVILGRNEFRQRVQGSSAGFQGVWEFGAARVEWGALYKALPGPTKKSQAPFSPQACRLPSSSLLPSVAAAVMTLRAAVLAVAAFCVVGVAYDAFVAPAARPAPVAMPKTAGAAPSGATEGWGLAMAGLAAGAHAGLAVAWRCRSQRQAAAKESTPTKYTETVADERLFEQVYLQYTSEYLKGPLYWHPDKLQGWLPDYPGTPMIKDVIARWVVPDDDVEFDVDDCDDGDAAATAAADGDEYGDDVVDDGGDGVLGDGSEGKYTSHVIGNLKAFSSNELAFLSMLFFGVGLYGNLQFNFYDPQWAKVDAGGFFNVSYIVESFLLPISFFMHIACYIQRQNGK
eukprot:s3455_g4.t1